MKGIMILIIVFVLGCIAGYFLHWMASLISVAVPIYMMKVKPGAGAVIGFVGMFLVWVTFAAIMNQGNDGLLATRVGQLLGDLSPIMLILLSGFIGGIGGILSGVSTALIRANLVDSK